MSNCCSRGPCRTKEYLAVKILSFANHSTGFLKVPFPAALQRLPGLVLWRSMRAARDLEVRVGSRVLGWCTMMVHHSAHDTA